MNGNRALPEIFKSKFVRSIALWIVGVFVVVSVSVALMVYYAFAAEINPKTIEDKQKQLNLIEAALTARMDEASSIAYSIGSDSAFYLEPVEGDARGGYEMSRILGRYLAGNSFVEHLAFYRLSEPDTLYVSTGEISFSDFWAANFKIDSETAQAYTRGIRETKKVSAMPLYVKGECKYLARVWPLPRNSQNPRAFVLMLIPYSGIKPMLEAQLTNVSGEIAVYDAEGSELLHYSTLSGRVPMDFCAKIGATFSYEGDQYVLQTRVSSGNSWI